MATLLSTLVGGTGSSGDDDAREFKNFAIYAGMWHTWPQSNMEFSSSYIDGYANDSLAGAYESRFLTSNHTLTIPSGVTKVRITCIGAGGGGGTRHGTNYQAGGGGGGGAFAMGEFNVSAGEQLQVNPGKSGRAVQYNYQADGGVTTCVGTGSLTTNEIIVSANGGTGGYQNGNGSGATTKQVGGSRLISGTSVTANGGNGGGGSSQSFGFGPEGYGGGGGGAAGFVLGNGGTGSNMSNNGGYSSFGGGGGAVGGYNGGSWPFGTASTNNQDYWAPAGAGAGANGANGNTSTATQGGAGRFGTQGGQKLGKYSSYHKDAEREGANSRGQNLVASNSGGAGASPTGVDGYLSTKQSTTSFVTFEKSFAYGPLAVAYSSGGGGGNGYSSYVYSHPGGHAGPGAGGGGGAAYNQNPYSGHVTDSGNTRFDFAKGQFCDYHQNSNFAYGSWGGNAGILGGGGGGGGYYGDGGCAGFGGGGGGAGGHYQSSGAGYGGYGGTGLVLIEWA